MRRLSPLALSHLSLATAPSIFENAKLKNAKASFHLAEKTRRRDGTESDSGWEKWSFVQAAEGEKGPTPGSCSV